MFVKILHKRYPGKSRRSRRLLFNLRRRQAFFLFPQKLTSFSARVQLCGSMILFLNVDICTSEQMTFPSKLLPWPKLDFSGCHLHESNKSFQSKMDQKMPPSPGLQACCHTPSPFLPNKTTPNFLSVQNYVKGSHSKQHSASN